MKHFKLLRCPNCNLLFVETERLGIIKEKYATLQEWKTSASVCARCSFIAVVDKTLLIVERKGK